MLRQPTREERTMLNRAFDSWEMFDYFKEKTILIEEVKENRDVVLLSEMAGSFVEKNRPHRAGLVIGTLKKGFTPSMAGADLFARINEKKQFPHIVVSEEAEKLVLYGRDVMGNSISSMSEMLEENKIVIILNAKREAIGIGRTRFSGRGLLEKGKVTVTTMTDAGYYLREENE